MRWPAPPRRPAERRGVLRRSRPMLLLGLVVVVGTVVPGGAANAGAREADPSVVLPPDGVVDVAVREIRPFAYPTARGWSGYSIDLWEEAARELGIPYRYVEEETVTDQLEAVRSGRADAALGAISITAERAAEFAFTQPMFDSGLQILVRDRGGRGGLAAAVAVLFSWTTLVVLGALALLLFVAGNVIWFVERRRNDDHFPRRYLAGVWEGIWWAMVTMATVGYGDRVARTRTGRLVSMAWMALGLIVVAQVTAIITSSLTVERIQNDVSRIGDLYGRPVATVRDTAAADYLADIDLQARGEADVDRATAALLDERVDAVVFDSPVLRYFARTEGRNRTEVVGPVYLPQGYGMAFSPGSPLVEALDPVLLGLREDGTAASLEERYLGTG